MSVLRVSLLVLIALLCMECCYAGTISRNFEPRLSDEMAMSLKKRPFCNNFAGCGRKRSQAAPGMPFQELMRRKQYADEEALGSVLDSEIAIDELSRQILTEAKLGNSQEAST